MKSQLFREKSMERVSSPEQLNDYIRVANPSIWICLAAVIILLKGVLAGLRPAVIAMIASAGISLLIMAFYGQRTLPNDLTSLDVTAVIIFAIGILVLRKWKPNPLWVMAGSGAAGIILYSLV